VIKYYAYKSGLKTYRKYAEDQVKAAFGGDHDWSLFEKEYMAAGLRYGKTTGTTILFFFCSAHCIPFLYTKPNLFKKLLFTFL